MEGRLNGHPMEIRVNGHGKDKLYTITCIANDHGFSVASVIIVGKTECALVDCQWTMANAHRVLAEIMELNLPLTSIYVTHAHPDHYFGLEAFTDAYPDAKVLARPHVAKTLNNQWFGKLEEWQDTIGIYNCPKKEGKLTAMEADHFTVDGEEVKIYEKVMGDLRFNTVVAIPSINTFIGSDVLFNYAHPFTCEVTAEERALWIKELDRFQAMNFEVVIPGHAMPGMPFDSSSFDFTRDYILATEEELAKKPTKEQFYYRMKERFNDAILERSNEMNSNVMCGTREWDWREEDE